MVDAAGLLRRPLENDNAAMDAEPSTSEPQRRKRRWYQFSLRTLLILTALIAVAAASLGTRIERKRKERESVEAIRKFGSVLYESYQMEPAGPAWLRFLLGDNFFSEVVSVALENWPDDARELGDAEMSNLKRFTYLRDLNIRDCKVTAAGMTQVKELSHLVWIDFQGSNINDAELANLKGLVNLQDLNLQRTQVTAAGIDELRKALPNCKIIYGDDPRWHPGRPR
jgi:hypothetical protein